MKRDLYFRNEAGSAREWVNLDKLVRAIVFLAMGLLLIACGKSVTAIPSTIPSPSATVTPTLVPTQTATSTIEPTSRPVYGPPTLIPTLDPTLLPELLDKALSIQTVDVNGYDSQRITGWDYGFGGSICGGYDWLDSEHLIIYPNTGQARWGEGGLVFSLGPQPVVINVVTGSFWLPPSNKSDTLSWCGQVSWSSKLKILIVWKTEGDNPAVSTYTYDGQKLANYPGQMSSISPQGTKILMADDTVVDLQTNKKIKLNWDRENNEHSSLPVSVYWTSDETRLYQCCYFYADLANGNSFRFTETDFLDRQGNPLNYEGLGMYRGGWIQDDKYFLVWWSYLDDGDMRYLPMFNPAEKIIYDVRTMAGISPDLTCYETNDSPDGQYLWIICNGVSYLVNLSDFETTNYPEYTQAGIYWSDDSQFAWLKNHNYTTSETSIEILAVASKELKPLPVAPSSEWDIFWHPTDHVLVYPAKDKNALIFLDAVTMTNRELPFQGQGSQSKISLQAWGPNGDKLIFTTEDHVLWQVDYPSLDNLEQITDSPITIGGVQFSPDGKSISFISGTDIYIVDT